MLMVTEETENAIVSQRLRGFSVIEVTYCSNICASLPIRNPQAYCFLATSVALFM